MIREYNNVRIFTLLWTLWVFIKKLMFLVPPAKILNSIKAAPFMLAIGKAAAVISISYPVSRSFLSCCKYSFWIDSWYTVHYVALQFLFFFFHYDNRFSRKEMLFQYGKALLASIPIAPQKHNMHKIVWKLPYSPETVENLTVLNIAENYLRGILLI